MIHSLEEKHLCRKKISVQQQHISRNVISVIIEQNTFYRKTVGFSMKIKQL